MSARPPLIAAFGDQIPLHKVTIEDTIRTMSFSGDGSQLASGDNMGRICLFQFGAPTSDSSPWTASYSTQWYGHSQEWDKERSDLADPRVTSLRFVSCKSTHPLMLSCGSKTAKLWRLGIKRNVEWGADVDLVPVVRNVATECDPECLRSFAGSKVENLVDLHVLADKQGFLLIDLDGAMLWDMERDVAPISVFKEATSSSPTDITASALLKGSNEFVIGDEKGICRCFDLRKAVDGLHPERTFQTSEYSERWPGCDTVTSIVAVDDYQFAVRRFGEVKLCDRRAGAKPIKKLQLELYERDMRWLATEGFTQETFKTCVNVKKEIVTGCYASDFIVWNWEKETYRKYHAAPDAIPVTDYTKRVTVCEAHPTEGILAVAATSAIYVFDV